MNMMGGQGQMGQGAPGETPPGEGQPDTGDEPAVEGEPGDPDDNNQPEKN